MQISTTKGYRWWNSLFDPSRRILSYVPHT